MFLPIRRRLELHLTWPPASRFLPNRAVDVGQLVDETTEAFRLVFRVYLTEL